MKKIYAILIALLMLCSPVVLADDTVVDEVVDNTDVVDDTTDSDTEDETDSDTEDETDSETEEEEEEIDEGEVDAGTTPDSALWGIDRALERIDLALTFGKSAKAKKGLAHARERLAEVQAMIVAKKLDHAGKAKGKYKETVEEIEENIDEISVADPEEELEVVDGLEQEIVDLDEQSENIKELVRVKVKGELTEEQQAKLDSILAELKASGERAKVRFDAKKDKVVIKYKTALKKTDAEVQEKLKELATARLNKLIAQKKKIIERAREKGKDVSVVEKRIADAEGLVKELDLAETPKAATKKIQKMLNFRQKKGKAAEPIEEPGDETSADATEQTDTEDTASNDDTDSDDSSDNLEA